MNSALHSRAILLIAVEDIHGVLRFPCNTSLRTGLELEIKPVISVWEQLVDGALIVLGQSARIAIEVESRFCENIDLHDPQSARLYVARVRRGYWGLVADPSWPTMPELLRSAGPGGRRRAILKAMQVFSGGLGDHVKVEEVQTVLRHRRLD